MSVLLIDREHSHSSLNLYTMCSQAYKNKYVDKLTPPLSDRTVALDAGVVCHNVLENWFRLSENERPKVIDPLLGAWWQSRLQEAGLTSVHAELTKLAQDLNSLNEQTFYTATGTIAKTPKSTTEYKRAFEALNLITRQAEIDQVAADAGRNQTSTRAASRDWAIPWHLVSLSAVFAETWDILSGWSGLAAVQEVRSVERHIRMTELQLPGGEPFQAKIDLHCTLDDGRSAVIDHKTGGKADEPPSPWEIAHHDQLLFYGWAIDAVDKKPPDVIGIHHVRGGQLVIADFDLSRALDAVSRKQGIINGIRQRVFVKQSPTDFRSPCHDSFWNRVCPWIPYCHREVYEVLAAQAAASGKTLGT